MQRRDLITSIEGMRAIAVIAVLLFHLDVKSLGGGFLGVDVFFVISGYIITANILAQLRRGGFSLPRFYYARFRRLIPALAVVTVATLAAGVVVMPPRDLAAMAQSAVATLVSLSNVLFWWQSDYFDPGAHTKPLLHTWSLGVEEQFYLFWPAALLVLHRHGRTLLGCAVLALCSFAAAAWLVREHASAVFYLSPFRVYQFMAGAIVAVTGWKLAGSRGNALHLLSLVALCAAIVVFRGKSAMVAGFSAAVASLGLILTRDAPFATRVTGHPALVWIGQRSYSIYLVHWPLVVLWKYATGPGLALHEQLGLGAASVAGAVWLHAQVEQRFRLTSTPVPGRDGRYAVPATVGLLVVGTLGAGLLWSQAGFPGRLPTDVRTAVESADAGFAARRKLVREGVCHANGGFRLADYDDALCAALKPGRVNVLVIGDSVGADVYMLLKAAYPDVAFAQATGGSCPPVLPLKRYAGCMEINRHRFETLASRPYDYVVFAAHWNAGQMAGLAEGIRRVRALGRRVVLVGPGLRFHGDAVRLVGSSRSLADARRRLRANEWRPERLIESMRERFGADVDYLDLVDIQCPRQCAALLEGRLLYLDAFHLTDTGARYFGDRLGRQRPDLFARRVDVANR